MNIKNKFNLGDRIPGVLQEHVEIVTKVCPNCNGNYDFKGPLGMLRCSECTSGVIRETVREDVVEPVYITAINVFIFDSGIQISYKLSPKNPLTHRIISSFRFDGVTQGTLISHLEKVKLGFKGEGGVAWVNRK